VKTVVEFAAKQPAAALVALAVARPVIGTVPAPLLVACEPELGTLVPEMEGPPIQLASALEPVSWVGRQSAEQWCQA
jgi:hypothetical protein